MWPGKNREVIWASAVLVIHCNLIYADNVGVNLTIQLNFIYTAQNHQNSCIKALYIVK